MDTSHAPESFRGMLLRHRGRTGLFQRDLAARAGFSRNTIQDWESGLSYPSVERLQALIGVLLVAGGLTAGREASEARELWAAVEREAPRMHTRSTNSGSPSCSPTDPATTPGPAGDAPLSVATPEPGPGAVKRAQDWGEASDVLGFVGRTQELARLRGWVLDERCRLLAILGMGGIGKTSLALPTTERVRRGLHPGSCRDHLRG